MSVLTPYGGLVDGQPATTGPHLLVSGPTGTGKTRRVLAPGLAAWDGPVAAVSSKRDLMDLTWKFRATRGPVYLLDLTGRVVAPAGVTVVRPDPAASLTTADDSLTLAGLLLRTGTLGAGTQTHPDSSFWQTQATGPLAGILLAAARLGQGMSWVLDAVNCPTGAGEEDADLVEAPSWTAAGRILDADAPVLASALAGLLDADDRLRDSVAATMRSAVAPWQREAVRGHATTLAWHPDLLVPDRHRPGVPTLYIVAPATGVAAGAAVATVHDLVEAWRGAVDEGQPRPRLAMTIDELANTCPLPDLTTYVTEARGLGVTLTLAVQATEQLRLRWGDAGRDVLRAVMPAVLVLVGAAERELLDQAAWWGGRSTRWEQSTDARGALAGRTATRSEALEGVDLLPRSIQEGRLLLGGREGLRVDLPDWSDLAAASERARDRYSGVLNRLG